MIGWFAGIAVGFTIGVLGSMVVDPHVEVSSGEVRSCDSESVADWYVPERDDPQVAWGWER